MTTMPRDTGGQPVQVLKPGRTATIAVGASSAEFDFAAKFASPATSATVFRLHSNTACHVRTAAGAATTNDMPMAADVTELFKFGASDTFRQIQATASGTLFVTEML